VLEQLEPAIPNGSSPRIGVPGGARDIADYLGLTLASFAAVHKSVAGILLLQQLNGFPLVGHISLRSEGLKPILTMTVGGRCARLGYALGYLRHGSFGRGCSRGPGRLRRVAVCALARLARCVL
jgi:hypothetical protein